MRFAPFIGLLLLGQAALADNKTVYLAPASGDPVKIAEVTFAEDRSYTIKMAEASFEDHFLSMRPFRCLEGPNKHWCHVPYPYEIHRNISDDLTDLEYDFLFVWKGSTEYGINMWNGVYYKLQPDGDGRFVGILHEMNMDVLSAPPEQGVLRPLKPSDLHESDPESHWLPRLIIE